MKDINTGGAAFPRGGFVSRDHDYLDTGDNGMQLRDWFAGQAMLGIIANGAENLSATAYVGKSLKDAVSDQAYCIADAMIERRKT